MFFLFIGASHIAGYFFVLFYFWILIVLSFIEIGYVIRGDKSLFKKYQRSNYFFLIIYFLTLIIILSPFILIVILKFRDIVLL